MTLNQWWNRSWASAWQGVPLRSGGTGSWRRSRGQRSTHGGRQVIALSTSFEKRKKCFRGGKTVGARFFVFSHSFTCVPLVCLKFRRCDVPSASLIDRDRRRNAISLRRTCLVPTPEADSFGPPQVRNAIHPSMHLNTFTYLVPFVPFEIRLRSQAGRDRRMQAREA